MDYKTYEPSYDLKPLVRCYWSLESKNGENSEKQIIVPDGCMEMIFHYGDLYRQYLQDGKKIIQPRSFVFGQLTRPLEIEPTGKTGILSVRFHPQGFLPLTTLPIKELENTATSLNKLFGEDGDKIEQEIIGINDNAKRIEHIERFLQGRLAKPGTIDRVIKSTVDTILTANGKLSVIEIAERNAIHRRQLERKFSTTIGLSPKQLSKTIRLQATLKMLLSKQFKNLTSLAYQGEYYDQAHFIKDFKEFTGFTPKEFYGESFTMSSIFYSDR